MKRYSKQATVGGWQWQGFTLILYPYLKEVLKFYRKVFIMREGFKNLKVYKLAYRCAIDIFEITKNFPKEERYALTGQIRRSSRSVCANIAEGYRKRIYPNHFRSKISDADAECSETTVWLDFSKDCRYISKEKHKKLINKYQQIGKMLGMMIKNPKKFLPKQG